MTTKGNVVLYLDKELVEKSKELGFNLSKTFENHLKHLINGNSPVSTQNITNSTIQNSQWWAEPDLNRRPLARKANVLTRLDDRPTWCWIKKLHWLILELCFSGAFAIWICHGRWSWIDKLWSVSWWLPGVRLARFGSRSVYLHWCLECRLGRILRKLRPTS